MDYPSLKKDFHFPKLIMASITPFGQTGPYSNWKGHCLNVSALAGIAMALGNPARKPLDLPMAFGDFHGAAVGGIACMTALFARKKTGMGLHCDIDNSHAVIAYGGPGTVSLPFEEIRILNFGTAAIAPLTARYFSEYGAEVIKIESKTRLDRVRLTNVLPNDLLPEDMIEASPTFLEYNRGARSIQANLKYPKTVELVKRLIEISDIAECVNENETPRLIN